MTFVWDENELNTEQAIAVRTPGNVFLIACPGSGKTKTLTYKIAYELSRINSHRKFVLAITYTNRAADEIRERVENLGVDSTQLWIGTIHAFCLEWIIKPYSIYEPALSKGYSIIDLHDREKLLEELCAPYKASKVSIYDCDFYFTSKGYRSACKDTRKKAAVDQVIVAYLAYLKEYRLLDFELMLWYAYRLIAGNGSICKSLSGIFKDILIDEFQDTKELQYEIISLILRATNETSLFIVGDPNQAIYESLGGYPIAIDDLKNMTGHEFSELELSKNYRSSERIISYFSHFNLNKKNIEPASKNKDYPSIICYNSTVERDNLVDEIIRIIQHNINVVGIPPKEICIIAPWWVHLASTCRRLSSAMPECTFDGPGMVPFARDFENFWFKVSRLALTEPSPGMYIRRMRWARELLGDLHLAGLHIDELTNKSVLRVCNSIKIAEQDGLLYLQIFFERFLAEIKVDLKHYPSLAQQKTAFFESSEKQVEKLKKEGIDEIGDIKYFKKLFEARKGITVSTIHGVKGAEFEVVIAYGLLEGMVPHFSDENGDESAQKLLYVIGSRAKKNLFLISESGRKRYKDVCYEPTARLKNYIFAYNQF
ncbi:ATP-dependent helicase [Rugamonas sp.]|uniref:UvrD-helicase domain-containing protein n=1 Tax=Rugamonas sp. TaxID=1926287 RepID=UPI0025E881D4|nr:ATP-dependent helicase [Rugamonas sp.]